MILLNLFSFKLCSGMGLKRGVVAEASLEDAKPAVTLLAVPWEGRKCVPASSGAFGVENLT